MADLELRLAVERIRGLGLEKKAAPSVMEQLDAVTRELNHILLYIKTKAPDPFVFNFVSIIVGLASQTVNVTENYRVLGRSTRFKMFFMRSAGLTITLKQIKSRIELEFSEFQRRIAQSGGVRPRGETSSTSPVPSTSLVDEGGVVGIEDDKKRVVEAILALAGSSTFGVPVISITGGFGSGKTTFAACIFNDVSVVKYYDFRLWLYVSDKFDTREILRQIHESLSAGEGEISYISEEQLLQGIYTNLQSRRCLIVLDDIRSVEDWEIMRAIFRRLGKGSVILVTTRLGYVAEFVSGEQYIHRMKPLSAADSWDLFTMYSRYEDRGLTEGMIKETKEIISLCEGVPLLIKVLWSCLRFGSTEKWDEFTQACLSDLFSPVFNELQDHLKPCLLYLGLFPEDQEIDPENLSLLWMIEGLISRQECAGKRTVDVAKQYLRELELKGMVETLEEVVSTTKKLKTCRIVKGLKYPCVSLAEKTCFLQIIDLRQNNCSLGEIRSHRLVIYVGEHTVVGHNVAVRILSLRVLHGNKQQQETECVLPTEMLKLDEFRELRILDFEGIDFRGEKLAASVFDLVLLKYLSFNGCVFKELPSSISKLSYLQLLDLRVKESTEVIIANVLGKLGRLTHLYLPLKFRTPNGQKLQLGKLTELETLENFNTRLCKVEDVMNFSKLWYMAAIVEGDLEDFKSITNYMKTTRNIWLHSSIDIVNLDCYAEERHSVLREFLQCQLAQILRFDGFIGCLPPFDKISQSFTELFLSKSDLKVDPMPTLEKLPNLRVLVLSDDAYMGKVMVCSASGFPQLKYLELSKLLFLEKWKVEDKAMPKLSTLKIKHCEKLEILPDCLNFRPHLQTVIVFTKIV